ncbi:hypothetical protein FA15DRAFT_458899 [Coprinopsis marcescibilis]|uniref:DUF6533 domain-containing protein n=1 Tax=Coprinopsis marcescibilis TaxID=230819 RepID=A0A5C3KSU7_COPMA|nr:hypothetical protein FA15DRAFT_458899 [Coprinopsis marcescibilis]
MASASEQVEWMLRMRFSAAVAYGLLYYDYFITFTREIKWIWIPQGRKRRANWMTWFFFANRYLSIIGHIPTIYQYFVTSNNPLRLPVSRLLTYHEVLIFILQVFAGVFLIIRTYALYHKSKLVLGALLAVGLAILALSVWAIVVGKHHYNAEDALLDTCLMPTAKDQARRFAGVYAGILALDLLIFGLTMFKSVQHIRRDNSFILRVLLRDGVIYFSLISLSTLSVIVSLLILDPYSRGNTIVVSNCLTATLISRLILNLHDPSILKPTGRNTGFTTRDSAYTVDFTTFIDTGRGGENTQDMQLSQFMMSEPDHILRIEESAK